MNEELTDALIGVIWPYLDGAAKSVIGKATRSSTVAEAMDEVRDTVNQVLDSWSPEGNKEETK